MTKFASKMMWAALALAALVALPAAAQSPLMKVDVPFEFLAGDKLMPAGEYRIAVDTAARRVAIRPETGSHAVNLNTVNGPRVGQFERAYALFAKYGTMHVLRSVSPAGRTEAFEAPKSRTEKEMARTTDARQVARVQIYAR